MGLDMYAYRTQEQVAEDVDFKVEESEEFQYWRKHPNLHGWMEKLYYEKGGQAQDFNCVSVRLDREALERLEADIMANSLEETTGFFFGQSAGSEEERAEDLEFVRQAIKNIEAGYTVYYSSWW